MKTSIKISPKTLEGLLAEQLLTIGDLRERLEQAQGEAAFLLTVVEDTACLLGAMHNAEPAGGCQALRLEVEKHLAELVQCQLISGPTDCPACKPEVIHGVQ